MMDSSIDTWPNELHAANFKIHHVVYRVSVFDCKLRSYSTRGLQQSLLRFRFELSRVYLPLRHTAKVYTPRNYFDWSQFGQHGGEHQTFQHSLKRPDNIVALKINPPHERKSFRGFFPPSFPNPGVYQHQATVDYIVKMYFWHASRVKKGSFGEVGRGQRKSSNQEEIIAPCFHADRSKKAPLLCSMLLDGQLR